MRTYLDIFDVAGGVFVVSLTVLSVSLIAYGFCQLCRMLQCEPPQTDDLPAEVASDVVEHAEPELSESRYRADDEAWDIIQACWDGTAEEEGSK